MQLIKIYADKVQIKSNSNQLGDISINNVMLLKDKVKDITLVCSVTAITKNEDEENFFDFEGEIIEPEITSTIECAIIGSILSGKFTKSIDVYPGTNVVIEKVNDDYFGEMITSSDVEARFKVGKYANYQCDANIDGNKLFQRHFAIVGNSGSGKSFTVASILEKLQALESSNIILFDIHGEYSNLSYTKKIKIGDAGLSFPMWFLPFKDIYGNILKIKDETSQVQISALRRAFYQARDSDKSENIPIAFEISEVIDYLERENGEVMDTGERYKTGQKAGMAKTTKGENNGKLTSIINTLKDKEIDSRYDFMFNYREQGYLNTFINEVFNNEESKIKVVDLSDVPHDVIPVVIAVLTKLIYAIQLKQEKENLVPLSIICDEAHVYIPSSEFALGASQKRLLEVFETIAKEGRKFGVSLGLVSQRPSELNRTILAQCANFIVLKMTNDTDKQMIKNILPEGSKGMIDSINLFKSGDCLIVGDCTQITFKINIDLPNEAPKSETISTWDSWKQPNVLDIDKLVNELLDEY